MYSVVIIEDHPAVSLAVRSTMELNEQFKVVGEAYDGPTGLGMIRELEPDLVILDLDLPLMNGIELIERFRSGPSNSKNINSTRFLVLSAQQESIFATRCMQACANGFLSKTESMNKLISAAQAVLSGYSMFPSSVLTSMANSTGVNGDTRIKNLSARELTILQCLARGMSNKNIAAALLINSKTVSGYKMKLFEKLGVSSVVELVDFSRANGLTN